MSSMSRPGRNRIPVRNHKVVCARLPRSRYRQAQLAAWEVADSREYGRTLVALAELSLDCGQVADVTRLLTSALAVASTPMDSRGRYEALRALALVALETGDPGAARRSLDECLELAEALRDRRLEDYARRALRSLRAGRSRGRTDAPTAWRCARACGGCERRPRCSERTPGAGPPERVAPPGVWPPARAAPPARNGPARRARSPRGSAPVTVPEGRGSRQAEPVTGSEPGPRQRCQARRRAGSAAPVRPRARAAARRPVRAAVVTVRSGHRDWPTGRPRCAAGRHRTCRPDRSRNVTRMGCARATRAHHLHTLPHGPQPWFARRVGNRTDTHVEGDQA